jgi:hypothetical protein
VRAWTLTVAVARGRWELCGLRKAVVIDVHVDNSMHAEQNADALSAVNLW